MKKIIAGALLGCSLLSTQSLAEGTNVYIGIDAIKSINTFKYESDNYSSATEVKSDSNAAKLKLGWIMENGLRTQIYYLKERYDNELFDTTNDTLTEVGIDFIKDFELSPVLSPFIQVGVGYGWMEIDGYSESTINETNAKIGGGLIFKTTPKLEIITGIDIQYKKWSDRKVGSYTLQTHEDSTRYYVGANYHF